MRAFIIFTLCFLISGCYYPMTPEVKRAACRKLQSDIIFNAATSDTRRAEIEQSERQLDQLTYDANC